MSISDRVFLRVYLNGEVVEVFQSGESQIVIGQEGDAHLKLKGSSVSSVHALIEKRQDGFYLCDLGSKTGTTKKGQSVLDERIESGEEFQVGDYKIEFFIGLPKPTGTSPIQTKTESPKVPAKPPEPPRMHTVEKVAPEKPKTPIAKPVTPKGAPATTQMFTAPSSSASLQKYEKYEQPKGLIGTYAPASEIKDLNEYIKPAKGSVIEVTVAWKERILNTYHFDTQQLVTIGSSPKNTIVVPLMDSARISHPLIKIDTLVQVLITSDMNGEVKVNDQATSINTLIAQGKLPREGVGYSIALEQSTLVRVDLSAEVSVYVRYVAPTPKPVPAPFLLLSTTEIATLLMTLLFFGILGIYFTIYTPGTEEEIKEEDVTRKAVFVYDRPREKIEVTESVQNAQTSAQPIKDLEKAPSRGEEGKAREAMPNKSQSKEVKLTTPTPGTGKGIQKAQVNQNTKADSGAKSQQPDPTKTGIFSAFGSKGFQDQLSKTYTGAGSLSGAAGKATGTGGQAAAGAGNTPGTGLKDIGAGGEGTATYGIAGVKTQGRGGGNVGYGTGNLGAKSRATIIPGGDGEQFSAGIDKEAIRKVIRDNQKQIEACYERGLNKQPNLYGKVTLKWSIVANGRVGTASVASTSLNNSEVENCVLSRLRTWKFPEPPPDVEADVSYPFLFNAQ